MRFSPLYFALKMERGNVDRQRGEANKKSPKVEDFLLFKMNDGLPLYLYFAVIKVSAFNIFKLISIETICQTIKH